MRSFLFEFLKRGVCAMGAGPLVLAFIYYIHGQIGAESKITETSAAVAIFTVTLLAFVAAGITAIYKVENLPLMYAIIIHGVVLYLDYLVIYLVNDWLSKDIAPLIIFTSCFVLGYLFVWLIIYFSMKMSAKKLNSRLSIADK